MILVDDQQKQQRRQKIQNNRLRKMGMPTDVGDDVSSASASPPQTEVPVKQEEPVRTHVIAGDVDSNKLKNLSETTVEVIENIMEAFEKSFDLAPEASQMEKPEDNKDFLNMAQSSVHRCVKMAKALIPFKTLAQEDKVTLIKGAVLEVLILRSVKLYDSRAMEWKNNSGSKEQSVSAAALKFGNEATIKFFKQYMQFAARFQATIQDDNIILMILIVMTVLSPDRPDIKEQDVISDAQETYASVLGEYIKANYPEDKEMFAKSLQQLTEIRELDESHMQMMMHVQVDQLQPLIKELFGML